MIPEPTQFTVDRLWPDPALAIDLDAAMAGFAPPAAPPGRPSVAVNMITSIDGRAQRAGTAEGLGSRADRRLMQLYRAAFDAVGSGAGTLRAAGLWLRVRADLAQRRTAAGRHPQPTGVLVAGREPVDTEAGWFASEGPRLLIVGSDNPTRNAPEGTDLLRAPTQHPEPGWVVSQLADRGIGSFLLEGGPHLNAAFLAADLIDELYWTIGSILLGTDALPMIAPIPGGSPFASDPRRCRLVSVLRHTDELFLRYQFNSGG